MSVACLDLPEDLTIHQARSLAPELISAVCRGEPISMNLSKVTRIDTAGIQLLWLLQREAVRVGAALKFTQPSESVTEMVDFYNLQSTLPLSLSAA